MNSLKGSFGEPRRLLTRLKGITSTQIFGFWNISQAQSSVNLPGMLATITTAIVKISSCWQSLALPPTVFPLSGPGLNPKTAMFSPAVIGHYRDMLDACHEYGLTPMVTLHHFTSPRWLMKLGGWTAAETPERFARYAAYVMQELGDLIPYVCTLNEVNLPDLLALIMGARESAASHAPVGVSDEVQTSSWLKRAALAFGLEENTEIHPFPYTFVKRGDFVETALAAHRMARAAIKRIHPKTNVGFSLALHELKNGERQRSLSRQHCAGKWVLA